MKKLIYIITSISIVSNVILGYFILNNYREPDNSLIAASQYPFLSPRIFLQNQNDILINFTKLRQKLQEYTKSSRNKIGFYFEYLPSGISIGVDEKTNYVSASLFKVPIVMAVYNEIENGRLRLGQELEIKESDLDPLSGNLWKKGAGYKITLEDAIKTTLIDSDNTAKNVLYDTLPQGALMNVFDALDIPFEANGLTPIVSPKNYSSILRSLYLSSILENENSNQILDLLSKTIYTDKLPAGVPGGIRVAHKIGIYDPANPLNSTYTDCGVIYVPKRPYILCIMTREDEDSARKDMINLSKIIYDFVSTANEPN